MSLLGTESINNEAQAFIEGLSSIPGVPEDGLSLDVDSVQKSLDAIESTDYADELFADLIEPDIYVSVDASKEPLVEDISGCIEQGQLLKAKVALPEGDVSVSNAVSAALAVVLGKSYVAEPITKRQLHQMSIAHTSDARFEDPSDLTDALLQEIRDINAYHTY